VFRSSETPVKDFSSNDENTDPELVSLDDHNSDLLHAISRPEAENVHSTTLSQVSDSDSDDFG